MSGESPRNTEAKTTVEYEVNEGRFGRELRLSKNSCPLCNFVQKEVEKGRPLPVEEWIYVSHLKNSHGFEP